MKAHRRPRSVRGAPGLTARAVVTNRAVLGPVSIVGPEQVRLVQGRHIEPGHVLPSGLVLEVTHNDIDGEVRLEMVGSTIHYVAHDDEVTVLAAVDRTVLDGLTVGEFIRRKGV